MKTATPHIPHSQNEAWGFFGAMSDQAAVAWPVACEAVASATRLDLDAARAFLDSRHGRHFADDVLGCLGGGLPLHAAINAAIARWMSWSIGRQTSREYGIPRGLPYLTGFMVCSDLGA